MFLPVSNKVPYAPPGLPLPPFIENKICWLVHNMLSLVIPAIHQGRDFFTTDELFFKNHLITIASYEHPIFQKTLFLYFRLACLNCYHWMQLLPSKEFLGALDALRWSPTVLDALCEALYLYSNTPHIPLIDRMIYLERHPSL